MQSNPKTGQCGKRYEVYKKDTIPAGLKALQGINFPGTTRLVFSGGVTSKSGDFAHGVAHGFITFVTLQTNNANMLCNPSTRFITTRDTKEWQPTARASLVRCICPAQENSVAAPCIAK